MAVTLVTTDHLRRRAFALVAPIEAVLGAAETDVLLDEVLAEAKAALEQDLETWWEQKVIRQSVPAAGEAYDVTEPPLDYYPGDFMNYNLPRWIMRRRPVVSIQTLRLQFSEQNRVLDVPQHWIRLDQRLGVLSVVPIGTQALIAQSSGAWFLPLMGQYHPFNMIPQFTVVDYTAGWYDPNGSTLPPTSEEVRRGILGAAMRELLIRADGIVPVSASAGGASQTFASTTERLKRADEDLAGFKRWWNNHYRPARLVML